MSSLGKILLYVALVGALVAAGFGAALIMKHEGDAATLLQAQQARPLPIRQRRKPRLKRMRRRQRRAESDSKLTAANATIDDQKKQLATLQQQATDAAKAQTTAEQNAKDSQDALDKIKATLGDETPDQYKADKARLNRTWRLRRRSRRSCRINCRQRRPKWIK